MGQRHHKSPMSNKRRLTSLDLNAKVIRRMAMSGISTDSLHGLLAIKMNRQQSAIPNGPHTSPPPPPTCGSNNELEPNTADFKCIPPLMRGLGIHKNNPVSVTKLTLGLRVGFISSHLAESRLIPDNPKETTAPPKMSLLLEAKSTPPLIMKLRIILFAHTMTLVGT